MANYKDNLKYLQARISYDNADLSFPRDDINNITGKIVGTWSRPAGYNNKGTCARFTNSTNNIGYHTMPKSIVPLGEKTIRFKMRTNAATTKYEVILSNWGPETETITVPVLDGEGKQKVDEKGNPLTQQVEKAVSKTGFQIAVTEMGYLSVRFMIADLAIINLKSTIRVDDVLWHDVAITWTGTTEVNGVKLYIDDFTKPHAQTTAASPEIEPLGDLFIGSNPNRKNFYLGYIDEIEFYNKALSFELDRYLIETRTAIYGIDKGDWIKTSPTVTNFKLFGITDLSTITENMLSLIDAPVGMHIWSDAENGSVKEFEMEINPITLRDYIGDAAEIRHLKEESRAPYISVQEEVPTNPKELFGKYPELVVYNTTSDHVKVTTDVAPYEIEKEFSTAVDIKAYPKDLKDGRDVYIARDNFITPLDELDGDLEVVTWVDREERNTMNAGVAIKGLPKGQFIVLKEPIKLYGYLEDISLPMIDTYRNSNVRMFVKPSDEERWYIYSHENKRFEKVNTQTPESMARVGMTFDDIDKVTKEQWMSWTKKDILIGVLLMGNKEALVEPEIREVVHTDFIPQHTSIVNNGSFRITNTTAEVELHFADSILQGNLVERDGGKVQYRVLLNNKPYYPQSGEFTDFIDESKTIYMKFPSSDILIDEWNHLRVEFKDHFGTLEYWQSSFVGAYRGLIFRNIEGFKIMHEKYYSNDIGEVINELDFGVIVAGQTTMEHEIFMKNQYGFDLNNVHIYAREENRPKGLELQFSKTINPFIPEPELFYNDMVLEDGEQWPFYVRIKTDLYADPKEFGKFDIVVNADEIMFDGSLVRNAVETEITVPGVPEYGEIIS